MKSECSLLKRSGVNSAPLKESKIHQKHSQLCRQRLLGDSNAKTPDTAPGKLQVRCNHKYHSGTVLQKRQRP